MKAAGKPKATNHPEKATSPKHISVKDKKGGAKAVVGKATDKKVTPTPPRDQNNDNKDKKPEEKIVVPNFISRVKIAESFNTGKVTLHEYTNCKDTIKEGAIIIEGVPNGATITNIITTSHMIEYLKLPLVAEIVSTSFPPVTVVQYGIPASGARIYANNQIIVLGCDYSLQEPEIIHDFVASLFSFAERHKVGGIITLDALSSNPSKVTSLLDQIQLTTEEPEEGEDDVGGGDYGELPSDLYALTPTIAGSGDEDFLVPNEVKKHQPPSGQKKDHLEIKNEGEKAHEKATSHTAATKELAVITDATNEKKEDSKEEHQVWFLTNNQKIGDFLKSIECEPVVEVSLSGVQAGLVNTCRFSDVPVILLLAKMDKLELGASPALLLIQTIEKLMKNIWGEHCCGVDVSKLEESTKSLEDKLNEILQKLNPQKDDTSNNMLYM